MVFWRGEPAYTGSSSQEETYDVRKEERTMMKRLLAALLAGVTAVGLSACASAPASAPAAEPVETAVMQDTAVYGAAKNPKYVFLFIGDGMSYPQFQAAADYLGAMADPDYMQAEPSISQADRKGAVLNGPKALNFMNFDVAGSAVTYDSCSFAPDSASTATSIATGHKTYSGMINVDETGTKSYETIAEKLHDQKDWKVGVVSSVNINHATPAALYDLAEEAGYKVVKTQAEAEQVTAADGKVLLIDEHLADSDAMAYELDREDNQWALADYVEKGIEVLNNNKGFFLMCEGGKIDWACHANDAGSTVADTVALADAVQVAMDFAKQHPADTLILVTGDHETGGLTIGYAGTDYDTYLTNLTSQTISYAKFDEEYVAKYKANKTPFETAMKDVEKLFGLKMSGSADDKLVLTDYEIQRLKTAYELAMTDYDSDQYTQEQYVLYGTYNPFSVTVTHILNNKSGVDFSSYSHTGLPVAVFAQGAGAENFGGYYDNTEIYTKLASMLKVK